MGEHFGLAIHHRSGHLFVVFLAHIGANDVPADAVTSSSGASRAVQQPASVVSTPAPNERMSASDAPPSVTAVKADTWILPDIDALPNNGWGKTVRFGRKLTVATHADLGPGVADPAKLFAGSNMSFQSCHLEAGTKEFGSGEMAELTRPAVSRCQGLRADLYRVPRR